MRHLFALVFFVGCAADVAEKSAPPPKPRSDKHSNVAPCLTPLMRLDMRFEVDSDFDLHLETPSGYEIYFGDTEGDGGILDEDLCISSCGPGQHGEAIYFCSELPSGTYRAWVENYDGRARGKYHLIVGFEVAAQGSGFLPNEAGAVSESLYFDVP